MELTNEGVRELIDSGIIGSNGKDESMKLKYGKVTALSPFRIKLDGDSASLPFSPPCLGLGGLVCK